MTLVDCHFEADQDYFLFLWMLSSRRRRRRVTNCPTILARPQVDVGLELKNCVLDLGAQVCAVERGLMDLGIAVLAIPSEVVERLVRPLLFDHQAGGVGEPDGVVGGVGGQQEHLTLVDINV